MGADVDGPAAVGDCIVGDYIALVTPGDDQVSIERKRRDVNRCTDRLSIAYPPKAQLLSTPLHVPIAIGSAV